MGAQAGRSGAVRSLIISETERARLDLQSRLDAQKSDADRNRLGQYATPTSLARSVVEYGLSLLPVSEPVQFLDPAFGTGSFFSALQSSIGERRIKSANGFEIDAHYGLEAQRLWQRSGLNLRLEDFTIAEPPENSLPNLIICNPPYVRHHHLSKVDKMRLQAGSKSIGVPVGGLAGLYCYFMALSHRWMAAGGVAGWLVPSEFLDVNYGMVIKDYLARQVTLLHIHRFDPTDVQFDDALVSSAVVWFRNEPPTSDHKTRFSFGGSLERPKQEQVIAQSQLDPKHKWSQFALKPQRPRVSGPTLGDFFRVQRGIATGDNGFFLLTPERAESLKLPKQFLRPILPSSRYLLADEIDADEHGFPVVQKQQVLLDCPIGEAEIEAEYPSLWSYLQSGRLGDSPVSERYLCRTRRKWYFQEQREPAPILCTYMGRNVGRSPRPFRFFLNHSKAIAGNVYLMLYPKPEVAHLFSESPDRMRAVWAYLNSLGAETLLGEGRVYGGGLYKLEPKELANVPVPDVLGLLEESTLQETANLRVAC